MEQIMESYADLIRKWAPRLDLVSSTDLVRLEERHLNDSLTALPLLDQVPPGPCADVGSGGGFPGIPLAIARPERSWHLIEPSAKRAAFLEEVIRELDLNCEVVVARVEEAGRRPDLHRSHALVVARALAPPSRALEMIAPLVAAGGIAAVFLGAGAEPPPGSERWPPDGRQGGIAIIRAGGDPGRRPSEE